MTDIPLPTTGSTNWTGWASEQEDLSDQIRNLGLVNVKNYGAVGDGTTDDTGAIQSVLTNSASGSTIFLPSGSAFRCTSGLTVPSGKRYTITGSGELLFNSTTHLTGSGRPTGLRILGSGTVLQGIRITNPNEIKGANTFGTSTYNQGIQVEANDIGIFGCTIDRWQQGITVEPNGEWANIRISGNHISNILGRGEGASDTTSENGEDGGDGIVVWGCQATITGNVVFAKAGADARIGIHTEELVTYEATPAVHSDAMVTISGNVIYGKFRRGIVSELVHQVAITGNTVADATWWAISFAGGDTPDEVDSGSITGNTILWTRLSTDNQGGAWNPPRAPIALYGGVKNAVVASNTIRVTGTAPSAFVFNGTSSTRRSVDCTVTGNTVSVDGGSMPIGFLVNGVSQNLRILNNTVIGFSSMGAYVTGDPIEVSGNHFDGLTSPASSYGIRCDNSQLGTVSGNTIRRVTTGINWVNSSYARINDNTVESVTTGVELFGSTNCVVTGNVFKSATTKLSNSGGTGNVVANNL